MINHINKITPLFKSDNIDLFTERYNNDEIRVLVNFEYNINNPNIVKLRIKGSTHKYANKSRKKIA
tara:strand:- start:288 stop:485 length:198 start_codon:yes stop_codon:yes gene_type:complete